MAFWLTAGGVFFVLSLGNTLKVGGWQTGIPLPFALFDKLPVLHHLRAPSRFSIMLMLCLGVLLAVSWTALTERISRSSARIGWTAVASAALVAEYLAVPIPLFQAGTAPIYDRIAGEPGDFTVVEIPGVEQVGGHLMYHQTVHGKRIFIGTVARAPREKTDYFFGLHLVRPLVDLRKGKISLTPELVERERELAPLVGRFLDIRYFVIDRSYDKRGVLDFLTRVLPVEMVAESERRALLRVQKERLPPLPWSIDPGAAQSRMHFEIGWSRPEREAGRNYRWANQLRSTVLLRRPSTFARELVLEISPLGDKQPVVEARLDSVFLGTVFLKPGWNEVRWPLPPSDNAAVERLELRWPALERASERDPRRLAARIGGIRFE
jgi:hypothetical protein